MSDMTALAFSPVSLIGDGHLNLIFQQEHPQVHLKPPQEGNYFKS